ncbi:glycerate kinase type-2 family protein [Deinococcus koreensis]|uniref:Glycerate kinase n=1 Tax=Deinococcus koreensis TaxID=2054903 RepID=A0A2K3UZD9_9DEIO|nr:glycerate kinase [Deinococcus koreensis]PNY81890.1 glycerate kinase [Deinococcus koreensis]
MDVRRLLEDTYRAALAAVSPEHLLRPHLLGSRPDFVLAFGKAAVPMARSALEAYPGVPALVVPPAGTSTLDLPGHVEVVSGRHPVPDESSVRAAETALARLSALHADQEALLLVSGGGSALLCAPDGLTLEHKQALTEGLLRAGADIREINTVRRHLSRIKGGRLAAATRARVRALLISDVVGDHPATIASGPTVPDQTTFADALAVLDSYGLDAPEARAHLLRGVAGEVPDTPKTLPNVTNTVIGGGRLLLEAAQASLEVRGVRTLILGDAFAGEVSRLARFHAATVRSVLERGTPAAPPVVLLSGGEATVTVRGDGVGGRNQEFALGLLRELGSLGVFALSAGSDGLDGSSDAAGAFLTPDSRGRAEAAGLNLDDFLARNDSGTFFAALGDAFVTGPTGHNLNDLRMIAVGLD